jgi:hypothetical protein
MDTTEDGYNKYKIDNKNANNIIIYHYNNPIIIYH